MPISKSAKLIIILAVLIVISSVFYFATKQGQKNKPKENMTIKLKTMKISSPAFGENESLPSKFTCDGESINPPLGIIGVPEKTRSLALIIDDPDAQMAGGFVHWVVFNINPGTKEIKENSVPENAIEGTTSAGQPGFVGPCPPSGTHHYQFKAYALDTTLGLDFSAKREDVEKAMEGHILDQAVLVGLYKR